MYSPNISVRAQPFLDEPHSKKIMHCDLKLHETGNTDQSVLIEPNGESHSNKSKPSDLSPSSSVARETSALCGTRPLCVISIDGSEKETKAGKKTEPSAVILKSPSGISVDAIM